jgi:hypothetical protein
MRIEYRSDKETCKYIKQKILNLCPSVYIKHRPVRNSSNSLILDIIASDYGEQDIVTNTINNFEKSILAIKQMIFVTEIFYWNKFK